MARVSCGRCNGSCAVRIDTLSSAAARGLYHPYAQPMRGWCKQEQDHAVIAAAHSLQELHHLNLGAAGSAHDFFAAGQQAAMHGLGSMDNASLEYSTGSNSVVYNGIGDSNNGGGYMMLMSTAVACYRLSGFDFQAAT